VLRDENENFFYQSQTSRRERESRLRQFSREFSRITFIPCLMTDIFKKKAVIFSKFLKMLCPFFSRNLNKNLIFRDEIGNFFQHLVSRDENGNFFILISCFEKDTRIWKSFLKVEREKINLILTRIPEIENSRYALRLSYVREHIGHCFFLFLYVSPIYVTQQNVFILHSTGKTSQRRFEGIFMM